jgi:chromosome partitioning protein
MKVYTIMNQKGGCAKTSMVLSMLSYFGMKGKKALAIDFDPQRSLTVLTQATEAQTIVDVLADDLPMKDAVCHTSYGDVVAGSQELIALESQFQGDNLTLLRKAIRKLNGIYDYVLIDCQPGLSGLPIAAMVACDGLIIPSTASLPVLYSIGQLGDTIKAAKRKNPKMKVEGILLQMFNSRLNASKKMKETAEQIAKVLGTKVFNASIRKSVVMEEAFMMYQGIFQYAPKSRPAQDYEAFMKELDGE